MAWYLVKHRDNCTFHLSYVSVSLFKSTKIKWKLLLLLSDNIACRPLAALKQYIMGVVCACVHACMQARTAGIWDSSLSTVTTLWTWWLRFDSWQGQGFCFFITICRLALRPTQPDIQWVPAAISQEVKWLRHESHLHFSACSAEVKTALSSTSSSPYVFMI